MSLSARLVSAALLATLLGAPALAQEAGGGLPAQPQQRQSIPGELMATSASENPDVWSRPNLLGDLGGLRSVLTERGIVLRASDIDESLGDPAGGRQNTAVYEGLTRFGLRVDTQKAFGLPGGTFAAVAYQIRGRGLSADALGSNLLTVSSIESGRSTRLGQLWYEQSFLGDKLTVRVGQILADTDYMTSAYGSLFVSSTFGWPGYAAANMPSGGPAYPNGALGVRVQVKPTQAVTVLASVFNGDPNGPASANGLAPNPSGTAFRLGDGAFVIAEVQYALNGDKNAAGLPGVYKLGGWYNSKRFADPGRSMAVQHRGDWSLYAVGDQYVLPKPGATDQGMAVFARIMIGPGDRNLLNFYFDAGLTYKGLLPGRPRDTLGLGFAYARYSGDVTRSDQDVARSGSPLAVRRGEEVLELSYQAVVAPWLQVQPFTQRVFNPSDRANPSDPKSQKDALVLGIRTNTEF